MFGCRFLAGTRLPGYFLAGTMGMGWGRFLLLNGIGISITVPATIALGWTFADQVESLMAGFASLRLVTLGLIGALLVVFVLRARRAHATAADSGDGPDGNGKS